jgi:hypothetical protein
MWQMFGGEVVGVFLQTSKTAMRKPYRLYVRQASFADSAITYRQTPSLLVNLLDTPCWVVRVCLLLILRRWSQKCRASGNEISGMEDVGSQCLGHRGAETV